jgi:hypothetical protein
MSPTRPLEPVVAEAVDGLGILVGQHKSADQRYRAAMAKGLTILRNAGYALDPSALHSHAIGRGWRASNAEKLREVATRINEGRVIQGMKSAPLRDHGLDYGVCVQPSARTQTSTDRSLRAGDEADGR